MVSEATRTHAKKQNFLGGNRTPITKGGGDSTPQSDFRPPLPDAPLPGGLLDPPLKLLAGKYFQELETLTLQILSGNSPQIWVEICYLHI